MPGSVVPLAIFSFFFSCFWTLLNIELVSSSAIVTSVKSAKRLGQTVDPYTHRLDPRYTWVRSKWKYWYNTRFQSGKSKIFEYFVQDFFFDTESDVFQYQFTFYIKFFRYRLKYFFRYHFFQYRIRYHPKMEVLKWNVTLCKIVEISQPTRDGQSYL